MEHIILSLIYSDTDPTSEDDNSKNYLLGQPWFNTKTSAYFICFSNEYQNAVWRKVTKNLLIDDFEIGWYHFLGNNAPVNIKTKFDKQILHACITPLTPTVDSLGYISTHVTNNTIQVCNSGNHTGEFCWFAVIDNENTQQTCILSIYIMGNGNIVDNINNIDCSNFCEYTFLKNQQINLTQVTDDNNEFLYWYTSDTSINPNDFILNSDMVIVGYFQNREFSLTVNKHGFGSVVSTNEKIDCGYTCNALYNYNDVVELFATPVQDFYFEKWIINEQTVTDNPYVLTINDDKNIDVYFVHNDATFDFDYPDKIITFYRNLDVGSVFINNTEIQFENNVGTYTCQKYTFINLHTTSTENYIFSEWSGDINEINNNIGIVVNENMSIDVVFEVKSFDVEIIVNGDGYIEGDYTVVHSNIFSIPYNTQINLSAVPHDNNVLQRWTVNNEQIGSQNIEVIIISNTTIVCNFKLYNYILQINNDNNGLVQSIDNKIDCDESICLTSYNYGQNIYLNAYEQNNNQSFLKWVINDTIEHLSSNLTLLITKDIFLDVFFNTIYFLMIEVYGNGEVYGDNGNINCINTNCEYEYDSDTDVILESIPLSDNIFKYWSGCDSIDEENNCLVTLDNNKTIEAYFDEKPQIISYGYVCGGQDSGLLYDNIQRFVFPLDNGTSLINNSTMQLNKRTISSNNSSLYFYIYGGQTFSENFSTIERYAFSLESGVSTPVSYLKNSKFGYATNNSMDYGYICGGGYYDEDYFVYNDIEKIDFANDNAETSLVATISISKYLTAGNNSSNYGYICGGWESNTDIHDKIERFSFILDFSTTSIQDTLNNEMCEISSNNSSVYGFIFGGIRYSEQQTQIFDHLQQFVFPLDSASCQIIDNLEVAKHFTSANNASDYGYICGGQKSGSFGILSSIDRFQFSLNNGISSEITNLANNSYKSSAADGTDFTGLFV